MSLPNLIARLVEFTSTTRRARHSPYYFKVDPTIVLLFAFSSPHFRSFADFVEQASKETRRNKRSTPGSHKLDLRLNSNNIFKMKFSASAILLAASSLLGCALAHNIQLQAHGRECFHEMLHKDDKMTVTFQVGDREFGSAGNLHIDFWV